MEKKKIVYLVDDSETTIKILEKVISSIDGADVVSFMDGESMLEKLGEQKADLIFLDYYLDTTGTGKMNGDRVLDTLKKQYPEIPVVLISGITDEEKIEKLKSVGFDGILQKDHHDIFGEVIRCVEKFLE